jgi:rubredoxin
MQKYKCSICGYIYDESIGIPEKGIMSGTKWEDLPDNFICPLCTAPKSVFLLMEATTPSAQVSSSGSSDNIQAHEFDSHRLENDIELSAGEISAICSSLAKGCEKQRLNSEMEAFYKIADYFKSKSSIENNKTLKDLSKMLEDDLSKGYTVANEAAKNKTDRGAMRSLVWSEKVSVMGKALLDRYAKEGDAMLENTKIFVCDICGFIILGDSPPDICPVCKVAKHKIFQVERR